MNGNRPHAAPRIGDKVRPSNEKTGLFSVKDYRLLLRTKAARRGVFFAQKRRSVICEQVQ